MSDHRDVHPDLALYVRASANGGDVIWRWVFIVALLSLIFWAVAMFSMGYK